MPKKGKIKIKPAMMLSVYDFLEISNDKFPMSNKFPIPNVKWVKGHLEFGI